MTMWTTLIELTRGTRTGDDTDEVAAPRVGATAMALLAAAGLIAGWGVALGAPDPMSMLQNGWRLPAAALGSIALAMPPALLAHHFTADRRPATTPLLALGAGNLAAALVLGSVAPLIALYGDGGPWIGTLLVVGAMALAGLAWIVGAARNGGTRLPIVVALVAQLVALGRLVHLAAPTIPTLGAW
jgi:hypothetical protein